MDKAERDEKRQAAKWAAEKRAGFERIFRRLEERAERRQKSAPSPSTP